MSVYLFDCSHQEKKSQWSHPRTGKTKRVYGELPFGWEKEVNEKKNKNF